MLEEFRAIPGFEERYEVSNLGRVRSLGKAKTFIQNYGGRPKTVTRGKAAKLLAADQDRYGYLRFTLVNDAGESRHFGAHVLVAMAFIPNPHNLPEVAHIDHNRVHNTPDNLKWASRSSNHTDSVIEDRYALAGPNIGTKRTFTADEIRSIRNRFAAGEKQVSIARSLGLRQEQVRKIVMRERWKHID